MRTVVALVAPVGHTWLFTEAIKSMPGLRPEWITYDREDDIRAGVRRSLAASRPDAIFLGPMPYDKCHDLLDESLEVGLLRYGPMDLVVAYSKAFKRGWKATPVSIDTFDPAVVRQVADALEIPPDGINHLPHRPGQRADEILDFHLRTLAEHREAYVITARTEVANRLPDKNRLIRASALPMTVETALHRLVLQVRSKQHSQLRFAAGVFTALPPDGSHPERSRVALLNLLLNTPDFADAWIENRGTRGVLVLAHKALLEKVTDDWAALGVLGAAETALGFRIGAGFGLGSSARTCVQLAEQAAARAEAAGGGCAFLLSDDGTALGPIGHEATDRLAFSYRDDGTLGRLATISGLSPQTISRLAAFERNTAGRPVSAAELAAALGITDPSGRRLIRTLTAHRLAEPAGSTQSTARGRPTRLYRLHIEAATTDSTDTDSQGTESPAAGHHIFDGAS